MTPLQLRRLADDCEERARVTGSPIACALYQLAARNMRGASIAPHLDYEGRRAALSAMASLAEAAHWFAAAEVESDLSVRSMLDSRLPIAPKSLQMLVSPTDVRTVTRQAEAMNARQLGALLGVNERRARRIIEREVRAGRPGFYRDGCHLSADRDAFERALSELCPNGSRALRKPNDGAHHSQTAQSQRQKA